MNYYIIIVNNEPESKKTAREIYYKLVGEGVWGFGEHTANRKKIVLNDRLVFYLAGRKEHNFVGTADVASLPKKTGRKEFRGEYWFSLKNIKIWDYPKNIRKYLENLEFIKKSDIYGTYLQGGSRHISKNDYYSIISEVYNDTFIYESDLIDEEIEDNLNMELLLKEAKNFNTSKITHKYVTKPHKIRIENRIQKKRIADIEQHQCQLCGWKLEYMKNGKRRYIIEIDHIIEKRNGGGEEIYNLWALCPNCHAKKTADIITINIENNKIYDNGVEIKLKSDNHLDW